MYGRTDDEEGSGNSDAGVIDGEDKSREGG